MRMQSPAKIGRYEIITLLGEGGMAEVYLALLRGPADFKKLGVIKRIRAELAWDRDFRTMFLNEARLAARLNHPNVIQTYQVLEESGTYSLAMEYLEGQPLSAVFKRLGRKALPLEEHLWILSQILSGLEYAHSLTDYDGNPLHLVHRDVCPANVFITYNGDVKLLDFGIAKAIGGAGITKPGTIKGRLGYCAPEQITGGPVDGRTDIFAVGVMLWEALAGRRMVKGATPEAVMEARMSGFDVSTGQLGSDLAPQLAEMCRRSLAREPGERYASATAFLRAIDKYLDQQPRRAARAQIAARLKLHFEDNRKLMRERVEAQLAMPFEAATGESAPPDGEVVTAVQRSPVTPPEFPEAPARAGRILGWCGLAAAIALATLAGLLVQRPYAGRGGGHAAAAAVNPRVQPGPQPSDTVVPTNRNTPIVEPLGSAVVESKDQEFVLSLRALRLREPLHTIVIPPERQEQRIDVRAPTASPTKKKSVHTRQRQGRLLAVLQPAHSVTPSEARPLPPAVQPRLPHEATVEPGEEITRVTRAKRLRSIDDKDPYQ